ncbi:MAG: nucleotidyltransferase domain-containing protein [Nitrospirae bacterium]|nr:nucleotidyltransferase domain-containing protein [Nitrospirota bacterium]MBF0540996.1 nucleotidyltransferase domain-containing protein [Nitrospirota bacterium]
MGKELYKMMDKNQLLNQVKKAVMEVEPDVTVILYDSRSRGDAAAKSDWDLLVLTDGQINDNRQEGDYMDFVSFEESQSCHGYLNQRFSSKILKEL